MKSIATILLLFVFATGYAQEKKKSVFETWPELKAFHGVMSQTFHPSEEGNLEPIKARATEMKEKATLLAESKIPADLDNEKVKAAVNKLKENTEVMEKMIADKANDKDITAYLNSLHDTFHEIIGLCQHEEKEAK